MATSRLMVMRRGGALLFLAFAFHAQPVQAQCVYSLSKTSVSVPSTANSGSLSVTTGTACSWTATSNVSWITITGGASGTGLGTVVYSVAINTDSAARTGTLIVAGQTVTVTQGANSCTYSLGTTSVAVSSTANVGSLSVATGTACSWTATANVAWITVTAGASGTGLGTVSYSVAANSSGAARTGTLTVAGQTVTIAQAAASEPPLAPPTNLRVIR